MDEINLKKAVNEALTNAAYSGYYDHLQSDAEYLADELINEVPDVAEFAGRTPETEGPVRDAAVKTVASMVAAWKEENLKKESP